MTKWYNVWQVAVVEEYDGEKIDESAPEAVQGACRIISWTLFR